MHRGILTASSPSSSSRSRQPTQAPLPSPPNSSPGPLPSSAPLPLRTPNHAVSFTSSWWKATPPNLLLPHTIQETDEKELLRHDMSRRSPDSDRSPSLFDGADPHRHDDDDDDDDDDDNNNNNNNNNNLMQPHSHYTQPTSRGRSSDEPQGSYDLKPPRPAMPLSNIELLADRLFSLDHLRLIMRDSALFARFSNFLDDYRPHAAHSLARYLDTQKAITAVDYANALAEKLHPGAAAAVLDGSFESHARNAIEDLVNDALPGYVTHRLVLLVTDALVKEITGQNTPLMRELVRGLAEVYCLTDPSLPDNPIVYASEEFYNQSQYGRDYVIGRNCRFLQGPKTSGATVARLIDALAEGQEICEVILNYRRDGSPFMNLLMIAPLYDNKGAVRYFIGAQIDVNGLIEGGRGLDSFERLLQQDRAEARYGDRLVKTPQVALAELSGMLAEEELDTIQQHGRRGSLSAGPATPVPPIRQASARRYLGMDDPADRNLWPAAQLGPSGRLPGVFQNYILVRPYPSLRITFTSPALRIPGLLQSKFFDRVGGPQHIRDGILAAFSSGVGVTAKISWHTAPIPAPATSSPHASHISNASHASNAHARPNSLTSTTAAQQGQGAGEGSDGKPRWIHCTPLLGSDDKVGVWMVVMVEREAITGNLNAAQAQLAPSPRASPHSTRAPTGSYSSMTAQARQGGGGGSGIAGSQVDGVASPRFAGGKLYREYLTREGRQDSVLQYTPPAGLSPAAPQQQQLQLQHTSSPMSPKERQQQQQQQQQQQITPVRGSGPQRTIVQPSPLPQSPSQPQRSQQGSQRSRVSNGSAAGFSFSADRIGNGGGSRQAVQPPTVVAQRAAAGEESFRDF